MPLVLTKDSIVSCSHGGTVSLSSDAKLKVEGSSVLLLMGVLTRSIDLCPVKESNAPSAPCKKVVTASGTAQKLTVRGQGVVLGTLAGDTDGVPQPAKISVTNPKQTRLMVK